MNDSTSSFKLSPLTNPKVLISRTPHDRGTLVAFTEWQRHAKFFKALAEVKSTTLVVGEIAQFTVETYGTVDAALSLGTGVSTALGHAEASSEFTFCLSGDCSFLHEGIGIIEEAVRRKVKLGLVVFDNHASWCTGGQPPMGDVAQITDMAVQKYQIDYETAGHKQIVDILNSMRRFNGVSILYLKVPLGKLARDEE